jgi:hypothetical protein
MTELMQPDAVRDQGEVVTRLDITSRTQLATALSGAAQAV